MLPSAAFFTISLTSSTEVSRPASNVKSTKDTLMVGTRTAKPSNLPFKEGNTKPTALAAPVLVGIMFSVAERARRKSLWRTSVNTWSLVKAWMVVIKPFSITKASFKALATGAKQLVVQDALDTTVISGVNTSWFTPYTTVASTSAPPGAEIKTFFAPASMWAWHFSLVVNAPVHSNTKSTANSFQGNSAGLRVEKNGITSPLITKALSW